MTEIFARLASPSPRDGASDAVPPGVGSDLHLLAAVLVGRTEALRLSPADVAALVPAARQHGVAPMLQWRIRQAGIELAATDRAHLRRACDARVRHYLQLKAGFTQVEAALRRARIPTVWLKGFALAHTVYPAPSLRPMRDLDAIVPAGRREAALACVQALGYSLAAPLHRTEAQELWHHYHLRGLVAVEIHYRWIGPGSPALTPGDTAWFWTQTREIRLGDIALTCLSPEATLLHLCAHAILQHGERDFLLARHLDLHLLLARHPQMDWPLVVERAAAMGWTTAAARALELTREYFATPLPDDLLERLSARRPSHDVIPPAPPGPGPTRLDAARHTLRGMTRTEQWTWMIWSIFPGAAFMRARYGVRARWQLPWFYLRRWAVMAGDVGKSMSRRLVPPSD